MQLAFSHRLLLLAGFFLALSAWHWRHDPSRWREYAFVFLVGSVAGVFGIFNDLVTSTISPAYFQIGKGIESGDGFLFRVLSLGFQAGFVAGALSACVYLYANNPNQRLPRVTYLTLCHSMLIPFAAVVVAGAVLGILAQYVLPSTLARTVYPFVPVLDARDFLIVAAIHAGLYVGLLVGVGWSVRCIRRERSVLRLEMPEPVISPRC